MIHPQAVGRFKFIPWRTTSSRSAIPPPAPVESLGRCLHAAAAPRLPEAHEQGERYVWLAPSDKLVDRPLRRSPPVL